MNRKSLELLLGAALSIALLAGLYLAKAHWFSPPHRVNAAERTHPPAPAIELTDINGARLSLSEYKGKVVLIDFWATWCGPCRVEIPWLVQIEARYRDQGFAVLGVAIQDSEDSVNRFYKDYQMNYPVALGNSMLAAAYGGVGGLPTAFLVGRDGRVYSQHSGTTPAAVFEDEIQQLLPGSPNEEVASFTPEGDPEEIDVGTPAEVNREVPGVDISSLSPAELVEYEKALQSSTCTCGCKFTVLQCRRQDTTCQTSKRIARDMLKQMQTTKKVATNIR